MKHSPLYGLNWRDAGKGFLTAVITALITAVFKLLEDGSDFGRADLLTVAKVSFAAGLAYLLKNFFTAPPPSTTNISTNPAASPEQPHEG